MQLSRLAVFAAFAALAAVGRSPSPSPSPSASPGASCLTQAGPRKIIGGLDRTRWSNMSLADNATVDASAAQWVTAAPKIVVFVGGGSGICWHGGRIIGQLPPSTPWVTMHDSYGMDVHAANFQLENVRIFDTGDGVTMDEQGDVNWHWRDVYFKYMRDDCVENDFLNSGTIEDSFFDGCYSGFSARAYTGVRDGGHNLVVVRNSLFRMQSMDRGYIRSGHGGFWKWGRNSPRISLYNVVFYLDGPTIENDVIMPPRGKLADCSDNVMVWEGTGAFPERVPSCFTLMTGAAGHAYWDSAVAHWKANHPDPGPDVGPPIVSLWAPSAGATLADTVKLTATAVDDRDVAGVQFKLNGRNIGAEVTTEAPITKFTLSWDSRAVANGTYTLTATARDDASNATTSAGVLIAIRN